MKEPPIILIHGGVNSDTYPNVWEDLERAAKAGYKALSQDLLGGVEEGIKVLESNPNFNSGFGSVLDASGEITLDSGIIEGATSRVGSIGAVNNIPHPISIAKKILKSDSEVMLAGEGATRFAEKQGQKISDKVCTSQIQSWKEAKKSLDTEIRIDPFTGKETHDTVGCVAMDNDKNLVAGTSTGGYFFKTPGRVGDSAIPGAGFFASSSSSVVCSGQGESFIELLLAKKVDGWIQEKHFSLEKAVRKGIELLKQHHDSNGGILALDQFGNINKEHNCSNFPVVGISEGKLFRL